MAVRMSGDLRREQILDVTKGIVDERGFHAVSIEAVARGAGISRPIVYEHFEGLHGLLEALVQREGARALSQLRAVLPVASDGGNPRQQLIDALRAYLIAVREDPVTWQLVLMPEEGAPQLLREQITAGRNQVIGQLAEIARPGFGSGRESPDPELSARIMSAIADEFARQLLTDPERFPLKRLIAHAEWLLDQLQVRFA
jgi:AcrR family transcriptional regulator